MSCVPDFPGVTPQLVVDDAATAIEFYKAAFGADELVRSVHDGLVMHCELYLSGGRILVIDDFAQDAVRSPAVLGGSTVRLHLYVPDVDAAHQRAVRAGASSLLDPTDAFWGDRYAIVQDPSGHHWSLATPQQELSIPEVVERGAAWSRDHQDGAMDPRTR